VDVCFGSELLVKGEQGEKRKLEGLGGHRVSVIG